MEPTAPAQDPDGVTVLLQAWSQGEPLAADRLFERVYPHLRYIASALVLAVIAGTMLTGCAGAGGGNQKHANAPARRVFLCPFWHLLAPRRTHIRQCK